MKTKTEISPEERDKKRAYQRKWAAEHKTKKAAVPVHGDRVKMYPSLRGNDGKGDKGSGKEVAKDRPERMTAIVVVLRGSSADVMAQLNTLLNV